LRLQKEAVTQLVKHHEADAAWVEVTEDYRIPDWQYREAEEDEEAGVLISLSPTGRVDIREGLVKREIERRTAEETADNPIAPRKPSTRPRPPVGEAGRMPLVLATLGSAISPSLHAA